MNPLRWDVLGAAFILSLPVLVVFAEGRLTLDELTTKLLWCLGAGWVASSLLRAALTPRPPTRHPTPTDPT